MGGPDRGRTDGKRVEAEDEGAPLPYPLSPTSPPPAPLPQRFPTPYSPNETAKPTACLPVELANIPERSLGQSAALHSGLGRLQLKDDQWLHEATADPDEEPAELVSQLAALEEEAAAATYYHYLPVQLGGVSCRALMTWRTVVVSLNFTTTMGLTKKDLKALPGAPVETASEGVNLEVLGVPK